MEREFRVFGPPGTGKTTYLSRQIVRAVGAYGAENVLVTSFTRAAAVELTGRQLPIPKDNVGTLHAHCYRAMGRPEIAETRVEDFNSFAPIYAVSGESRGEDMLDSPADTVGRSFGDAIKAEYQRLRGRMVPRDLWPSSVRGFAAKWEDWKRANNLVDYTDMIETAWRDFECAPGAPDVLFVDEAQDLNPLMLAVVRKWANKSDQCVIAGDDDQVLYRFLGATPKAFLEPDIPAERKFVLRQSYRVPRAVQEWATKWISLVSQREPKEYQPRDYEGAVIYGHTGMTYRSPLALIDDAQRHLSAGKTVMFLGACSYHVDPIRLALASEGIRFHNPYRSSNMLWNPLTATRGVSVKDKFLAFLRRPWTVADAKLWTSMVKVSGLRRHIRELLEAWEDDRTLAVDEVIDFESHEDLMDVFVFGDESQQVDWLAQNLLSGVKLDKVLSIYRRYGAGPLQEAPQVIVGTIHSVKGGEADVVYLFPDLSIAGGEEWNNGGAEARDSVIRQFYVGATRARDTLVLCQPASAQAVSWIY